MNDEDDCHEPDDYDPECGGTDHYPFNAPQRFRQALDWYLAGIGLRHEPVAAAAVFSAFTLLDPAGVLYLGDNPDPADEYRSIMERVWFETCRGIRKGGVSVDDVMTIVVDALIASFGEDHVFAAAPKARTAAELIWGTVSAFPATCHDLD